MAANYPNWDARKQIPRGACDCGRILTSMSTGERPPVLSYANETIIRARMTATHLFSALVGAAMIWVAVVWLRSGPGWFLCASLATGLGILWTSVGHIFPGASHIRIGESGFWIRSNWVSSNLYRWDQIESFEVVRGHKGATHIEVVLRNAEKPFAHRLPRAERRRASTQDTQPAKTRNEYLTDAMEYGMTDEELAALLDRHRLKATGGIIATLTFELPAGGE